ncbi:MAG: hypothetical protein ACJASX_003932 [Limisphaerales bacterium]|jgi:hypothetical protein
MGDHRRRSGGDIGEFTLAGIAPTAMGGEARFDRIELMR